MIETRYLLRTPRNADRLLRAVSELEHGLGTERVGGDQPSKPNLS